MSLFPIFPSGYLTHPDDQAKILEGICNSFSSLTSHIHKSYWIYFQKKSIDQPQVNQFLSSLPCVQPSLNHRWLSFGTLQWTVSWSSSFYLHPCSRLNQSHLFKMLVPHLKCLLSIKTKYKSLPKPIRQYLLYPVCLSELNSQDFSFWSSYFAFCSPNVKYILIPGTLLLLSLFLLHGTSFHYSSAVSFEGLPSSFCLK